MLRLPDAPMLAAPTTSSRLPQGCVAEPKWDGFRALLAREAGRRPRLISRRGVDLTSAFPEVVRAAATLPDALGDVVLDGELVVWNAGQLDFKLLLARQGRRQRPIGELAAEHPASYVAFDLLHLAGHDLIGERYDVRRRGLERIFTEHELAPQLTLCPSSGDPAEIELWLTAWTGFGIEGLCFKRRDQPYLPGRRGWTKYRVHDSVEAVVGAVTGSPRRPEILHLGVPDPEQGLRYLGRTVPIGRAAASELAAQLEPAQAGHPWHGEQPTPAFEPSAAYPATLVEPTVVVEVVVGVSTDTRGRWRQPAHLARLRPDLAADELLPAAYAESGGPAR
ncbi:MAG TPA: hypothetical protein VFN97_13305 [Actinospica sp.]|nr:hypothetical protein [Actinospica sp.]